MRRKTVYRAIEGIDRGRSRRSRPGCGSATPMTTSSRSSNRVRRTHRQAPDDARVRGRSDTTVPADVIEHFGSWNRAKRRPASCRAASPPAGAADAAQEARRRSWAACRPPRTSRPARERYPPSASTGTPSVPQQRAQGSRLRRRRRRGAPRARHRPGRLLAIRTGRLPKFSDWANARRTDASCSPSGRCTACSTPAVARGRRSSSSSASDSTLRASPCRPRAGVV